MRRKVKLGQVNSYDAYGFHEDYELVKGEWTFQIWYQDKMLVEQKFTTYWPEDGEHPETNDSPGSTPES